MLAEAVAAILGIIHFGTPLAYYNYMKKYYDTPWDVVIDRSYRPQVTVIIPTHNEAKYISAKLDDLVSQSYSHDLMEIIVVDDGSTDGTPDRVEDWTKYHPGSNVKPLRRLVHQGKLYALDAALKEARVSSEIVIITDADALFDRDAVANVLPYFADSVVGCVTCSITYRSVDSGFSPGSYRSYYNKIRVAESKKYSTPILNGPLLAIRTRALHEKGLPGFLGSDDSAFGSFLAFLGYRSIQADDVIVTEPIRGSQFRTMVRRGNRLVLNFLNTKRYAKKHNDYADSPFNAIWKVEWWINIINPWILVAAFASLLYASLFQLSLVALIMLGLGAAMLGLKTYRMWISQQVYLIIARLRNLWTRDVVWGK